MQVQIKNPLSWSFNARQRAARNIEKTKNMTIEELNGKLMNLMETKATSDDKTDTMEETMKEKLLLMPEDNKTTEKTKDAVIDKSTAEIANMKEEILPCEEVL